MNKQKVIVPLFGSLIRYARIFYRYAGKKLWLLCVVIFIGGSLDGLGLSLLLPILDFQQKHTNGYTRLIEKILNAFGLKTSLAALLVLLLVVFLFKGLFMLLQGVMTSHMFNQLVKSKRLEICRKYSQMSYLYYTDKPIGFLNNIITTEIDRAVGAFGQFIDVLVTCVYIMVYLTVASLINAKLTLIVLVLCVVLFRILRVLSTIARRFSIKVSEKNAQIQTLLIQMIYNFKYLKATNRFNAIYQQLAQKIEEHRGYQFRTGALAYVSPSLLEPLAVLFLSGMILYYVSYQGKSISEILILLLFFYKSFTRLFGFQIVWQKFSGCVGGVEVLEQMSGELERNKEAAGTKPLPDAPLALSLKDVFWRYGQKNVLKGITLNIPANTTIAIVGESGSGKTTILDLIAGLMVPQEGTVTLNGCPYQNLDLQSLRFKIGYVTQEPVIFNDTIANNISFWEGSAHDKTVQDEIEKAAQSANCRSFILHTEKGYETVIGDKGVKVSAGQRQRIAIARELFKKPQIMIFDEATSALDSESERLIQESITAMMGKMTMIIVAHRLSTIRDCDQICVLYQGRIVENGSFSQLKADKNSRFAKMCEAQNL